MVRQAYELLESGHDWLIRTTEDMNEIANYAELNKEVNPETECLINYFQVEEDLTKQMQVLNKSEMMIIIGRTLPELKINKFHIKEWQQMTKMEYKPHKVNGILKKGFKVYTPTESINLNTKRDEETPF